MIVNKKLDRFKQWAGERMGGEVKTSTTDQFKVLEQEMDLRQQGMEKMQESMNAYIKAISKRSDLEKKEKSLPIAHLGNTMTAHGDDFEHDSDFGQCLIVFGRGQERLARSQESYITAATNSWLESLDRSLVQMKEYQAARRKLESRRLAYDTSLAKMQKAKREDFRVEEELRSQQAKYEEAEADVERRMWEIKDAEASSVNDLTAFLEAQLAYHDRCREALIQLQNEWPTSSQSNQNRNTRPPMRSRSNTVRSQASTHSQQDDAIESRVPIRSSRMPSSSFGGPSASSRREEDNDRLRPRPGFTRSTTYQTQAEPRRDMSPIDSHRLSRVPSDSLMIQNTRSNLRRVDTNQQERDVFGDESASYYDNSSDQQLSYQSASPTSSQASGSIAALTGGRKAPPPPPPSRASKPGMGKAPPPPPPAKRSLIT